MSLNGLGNPSGGGGGGAVPSSSITGNIPAAWLGSSSTTAAAGNDSRITGAAQLGSANTFTAAQLASFAATANSGEWNAGSGAFDGTTTGHFTGSANGTKYAANGGAAFTGNLIDLQTQGTSRFAVDYQGNLTLPAIPAPTAPTAALAGAGAGSVTNGTHVVAITFVNANGETTIGASSASVNVVDNTTNGKIAVTGIPVGPPGTTGRNVYVSKTGTATPLFKVVSGTTLADNTTTTYTINTADASLTATQPLATSTAYGKLTLGPAVFGAGPSGTALQLSGVGLSLTGGTVAVSGGALNANASLTASTTAPGTTPAIFQGAASQTADVVRCLDPSGNVQFALSTNGSSSGPYMLKARRVSDARSITQAKATLGAYNGLGIEVIDDLGAVLGYIPLYGSS